MRFETSRFHERNRGRATCEMCRSYFAYHSSKPIKPLFLSIVTSHRRFVKRKSVIGSSSIGVDFCRVRPPASRASGCSAQFRATTSFVSLHCFLLRRPPARKPGSVRFVRNRIALPIEAKRAIPFLQTRNAKHEHDRKLILNASTAEQHRQTDKTSKPAAGMENRFTERMSDTCRHTTLPDTGTGNGLLEFAYHQSSLLQSRMRMPGCFNP
jgi:hypothetical protein